LRIGVGGPAATTPRRPIFIFIFPLCRARFSRIDRLRLGAAKRDVESGERRDMADIVFLAIGVAFFALMVVYALACERL
jgi:hypothetical protein